MSLRALAERTEFSASFLSQIENGQCSPSISSMEKIANALGVTLGQFFLSANQQVVNIVRASDRAHMALDWSRAEIASLGSLSSSSQFRASMLIIKPAGLTGKHATPSISDEFAMVFAGKVILKLQDSEQIMERGDSVTIIAGTSLRERAASGATNRTLSSRFWSSPLDRTVKTVFCLTAWMRLSSDVPLSRILES